MCLYFLVSLFHCLDTLASSVLLLLNNQSPSLPAYKLGFDISPPFSTHDNGHVSPFIARSTILTIPSNITMTDGIHSTGRGGKCAMALAGPCRKTNLDRFPRTPRRWQHWRRHRKRLHGRRHRARRPPRPQQHARLLDRPRWRGQHCRGEPPPRNPGLASQPPRRRRGCRSRDESERCCCWAREFPYRGMFPFFSFSLPFYSSGYSFAMFVWVVFIFVHPEAAPLFFSISYMFASKRCAMHQVILVFHRLFYSFFLLSPCFLPPSSHHSFVSLPGSKLTLRPSYSAAVRATFTRRSTVVTPIARKRKALPKRLATKSSICSAWTRRRRCVVVDYGKKKRRRKSLSRHSLLSPF